MPSGDGFRLPFVVWVAVQGSLADRIWAPDEWRRWTEPLIGVPAAILAGWTMALFIRFGDGTAAPWDPPLNLVVRGPYCHVRNPMITGVILLLMAESLTFGSWAIAVWLGV